ncbi:hypothetical protein HK405_000264, partial [Cladochytrium tenue]
RLSETLVALQAQLDAARLARDQAAIQAQKRIAAAEQDMLSNSAKLRSENEDLKLKLEMSEAERLKLATAAATSTRLARTDTDASEARALQAELGRRELEIGFLKDTVRRECEERMELLARLDAIERGLPTAPRNAAAAAGPTPMSMSPSMAAESVQAQGKQRRKGPAAALAADSAPRAGNASQKVSIGGGGAPGADSSGGEKAASAEPEPAGYLALMATAAARKNERLRSAAKRNAASVIPRW